MADQEEKDKTDPKDDGSIIQNDDQDNKNDNERRSNSRGGRRSRSPHDRRSRSNSRNRSRSRSRSRSRDKNRKKDKKDPRERKIDDKHAAVERMLSRARKEKGRPLSTAEIREIRNKAAHDDLEIDDLYDHEERGANLNQREEIYVGIDAPRNRRIVLDEEHSDSSSDQGGMSLNAREIRRLKRLSLCSYI